jgi:serine/threonine protein kinase
VRAKFFGKPFTKPRGDAPLGAGDALGPYTLVRPIGEGAAAVVYEGQDTRIGRRVAVKVLNHAPGRGKDWYEREIARFQR